MLRNIFFAAALFICIHTLVQAGGMPGKMKNPVVDENCLTKHPLTIEEKQCTKIPSTSSIYVLYCNQKTVSICNNKVDNSFH